MADTTATCRLGMHDSCPERGEAIPYFCECECHDAEPPLLRHVQQERLPGF